MARPQAREYDQRREHIVEQAGRLYARRGFLGASLSELAQCCDISKSAIYHYYASKEDILFDVMQSHMLALGEATQAAIGKHRRGAEDLQAVTRAFMRLYVGAQARHRVLLNELDHLPKQRRAQIVALQRGLIVLVEGILVEISPPLKRNPRRLRAAAMLYFGMINWTHTWFNRKAGVSELELADMVVSLTLTGLAGPPND